MIKKYIFNTEEYSSETELRQHLIEKVLNEETQEEEEFSIAVPEVTGDPVEFWSQFGVTYSEEPDPVDVQLKALEAGIQAYMDSVAKERGYDNIYTAIGYANSTVTRFREDAEAANQWRDQVWVTCHRLLDQYLAGEIEALTLDQVIERLPQIQWSTTDEYSN